MAKFRRRLRSFPVTRILNALDGIAASSLFDGMSHSVLEDGCPWDSVLRALGQWPMRDRCNT